MTTAQLAAYIGVMAGVTYLVRMLPIVIFRKKIKSRFVTDFLYYVPYAVLGAMTIPAVLFSTGSIISAAAGLIAAVLLAFKDKGLLAVAAAACIAAFAAEVIMRFVLQ
ncbi:MAG: AzlD domain-containing protein [Oscillospiraceae bacterium]|nr:AzlD domain-containing protein [Oscillospiraceae bacterium]